MTTMRWNAGVATALSVLLSTALAAGAAPQTTSKSPGPELAGVQPSVAVHRIAQPANDPHRIDVFVEEIRGVLVSDGALPGSIEILLTGARIPSDLERVFYPASALVERIHFARSAWGRETEAQITLSVAEGVSARTRERGGVLDIELVSGEAEAKGFVVRLHAQPFPGGDPALFSTVRQDLQEIAAAPAVADVGWWNEAGPSAPVTAAQLAAVRDAQFALPAFESLVSAAQDERAAGSEGGAETGETGPDAPAEPQAPEEPSAPVDAPVPPERRVPTAPNTAEANKALTRQMVAEESRLAPAEEAPARAAKRVWTGNPLQQPVTIDFRDMDLLNVVQILADMAGINVVAGADLTGPVTLNLRDVPLMQAMETALRLNGLGIVEEAGIYHIKPYVDAIASQRSTEVIEIENGDVEEIVTTLKSVLQGSEYEAFISLSSNKTASTVIIAGPEVHIAPLVTMAKRLDVEQAILPTVTLPVKLNYAEPQQMMAAIDGILTPEIGRVALDERARIIIVTDIPIVVEKIKDLVEQLDIPVKQVAIDAMIVDVTLTDAADTGVDWLISAVQSQSRRNAAANNGIFTGNLQELSFGSDLNIGDAAGLLNFGILSGDIDWRGVIQAEVRNNNSTLLSNPKLITVENQKATITIASEIPYVELTQTDQGGQQTSTEFKPIGTTLEVTPKVTHDDHIIAQIVAKESTTTQVLNGVPVEDLRQIDTTPHIASGQTIYVGGLRKNNDTVSIRKVPVLGDVPVVNFLFRSNQRSETVNELLIFLTCSVLEERPSLTGYQREKVELVRNAEVKVSAETALIYDAVHPSEFRDPAWKWRKHGQAKESVQASDPAE